MDEQEEQGRALDYIHDIKCFCESLEAEANGDGYLGDMTEELGAIATCLEQLLDKVART